MVFSVLLLLTFLLICIFFTRKMKNMFINQDTMNEVKVQDTDTKYMSLNLTVFWGKKKNALIGKRMGEISDMH